MKKCKNCVNNQEKKMLLIIGIAIGYFLMPKVVEKAKELYLKVKP